MNIQTIASKDNEKVKFLRKLNQKKYREEFDKFIVENLTILYDAVDSGYKPEAVFVTPEFIEKNLEKFNHILDNSNLKEYSLIDEKINKSFSNLDTAPGICAVFSKLKSNLNLNSTIIYLNNINDPGNLGTILRSALAFNLKNIVIDENSVDVFNHKTIQSARDSIFKLNISFDKNLEILNKIKLKMPICSTRLEGGEEIDSIKEEKFCLILGNETHGVSKEIQDLSDKFIKIQISSEIESLNVASSAAILFSQMYKNN